MLTLFEEINNHPGMFLNRSFSFKHIKTIPRIYRQDYLKLRERVINSTFFLPKEIKFHLRMKFIKEGLDENSFQCPVCPNPLKYNTQKKKFMLTCNTKDDLHKTYTYDHITKTRENTVMNKYGTRYYTSTEEFKNKSKQSNFKKLGVDNPFKSKEIQAKIQAKNIKNYKVTNILGGVDMGQFLNSKKHLQVDKIIDTFGCSLDTIYRKVRTQKIVYNKLRGISRPEQEIIDYLKSLIPDIKIIKNSRKIITPKELDIYLPEYNLAIEYNGLMFHSQGISSTPMLNTPNKDPNIHLNKTDACMALGINLLHINENEWKDPNLQSIWKSIISYRLNQTSNKIGARKCTFAPLEQLLEQSKAFIEENHLQGSGAVGGIRYGLIYNNELVSLMTFSKARFSSENYELIRFVNKKGWVIHGAASKLLKAFEKDYPGKSIVSYANKRWSDGNLYETLGFELKHTSKPNFYVFHPRDTSKLWHRVSFQKHKLKEKLDYFDPKQTAEWNIFNAGYRKIYDSGNYVFEK